MSCSTATARLRTSGGITTDSKDNGVAEGMFWDCMEAAGFTEADL